jgi:hypothetical protein
MIGAEAPPLGKALTVSLQMLPQWPGRELTADVSSLSVNAGVPTWYVENSFIIYS